MGFKIEVLDSSRRPKANVSVKVMYDRGQDNGQTDANGIFDTKGSGGIVKEVYVSSTRRYSSAGSRWDYGDTLSVVDG